MGEDMRKFIKSIGAVALLVTLPLLPAAAHAQAAESSALKVGGSISLVSDYRWRGGSLSDTGPAVQGGFSTKVGNFYAGVWGSNIGFLPASEIEVDYYAGYVFGLGGDTKLDLQGKIVSFPGQKDSAFGRVSANLTGKAGVVSWGLHGDYEPAQDDTLLAGDDNHYLYATASLPLGDSGVTLSGKVGREDGAFADDKVDWLLGASKTIAGLGVSLQYIGTNKEGRGLDDTVVLGISKSF
jgi:uncharacterized protein (TIGR02001 family)